MSANSTSSTSMAMGGWDITSIIAQFDFSDHSNRQGQIIWINATFISLIGLIVSMRIFTRAFVVRKLFLDDILVMLAAALTITLCVVCIHASKTAGLGKHVWFFDLSTVIPMVKKDIKYLFVSYVLYACAIAFTKLSIIASYVRIIPDRGFRIVMFSTAALVAAVGICSTFTIIFQCHPVKAAWDFSVEGGKCIVFVDFLYASSALGLFTDLILTLLPIPYFWKLKLPIKQRTILILLFGLGSVASIAVIIRFTTLGVLKHHIDITYLVVEGLNWTVVECSLGIICVSIPPIRALIMRISPSLLPSQFTSRKGDSSTGARKDSSQGLRSTDDEDRPAVSAGSAGRGQDDGYYVAPLSSSSRDIIVKHDLTVDIEMDEGPYENPYRVPYPYNQRFANP